jgi:large conductance mechanosensitive channel
VDLAVGVIIGGAFGKIVASLVDNIIMPPIGLLIGGVDFTQLKYVLKGADGKGEVAVGYGMFIQNTVNFLIIALALFLVIQAMNRMKRGPEAVVPAAIPEDVLLLRPTCYTHLPCTKGQCPLKMPVNLIL